jgi:hypothetical protein
MVSRVLVEASAFMVEVEDRAWIVACVEAIVELVPADWRYEIHRIRVVLVVLRNLPIWKFFSSRFVTVRFVLIALL